VRVGLLCQPDFYCRLRRDRPRAVLPLLGFFGSWKGRSPGGRSVGFWPGFVGSSFCWV